MYTFIKGVSLSIYKGHLPRRQSRPSLGTGQFGGGKSG